MSAFYKMDPAAWDFGTTNLTLEEEAAYLRIINAIHKHDQPVPDNDRVLAGMFRCSTRKARSLLDALMKAGKVRVEDGKITNDRAVSDMVHRGFVSGSRAESGAKGGRVRAERAANALKEKESDQAIASPRIEENREEKKERTPLPPKGGDGQGFTQFWDAYPHRAGAKRNRKGAEAKWRAALRRGVTADTIMAGVERMKADPAVARGYARDPATWLNQEGWADEISNVVPLTKASPREVDLGGGWTWMPGDPIEYNRITKDVRDAKHIRDRRMAEAEIAYRGLI